MSIHIWNCATPFEGKVNFVDSNNVLVGYDLRQDCCEHAYWRIFDPQNPSDTIHEGDDEKSFEAHLDNYNFDPDYCVQTEDADGGGQVTLRLVCRKWNKPDKELILKLINSHNGYYSHGFVFRGNKTIDSSI